MGDVVAAFVRQSAMKIDAQRDQKAADEILIPIERKDGSGGPMPREKSDPKDGVQSDELRQARK